MIKSRLKLAAAEAWANSFAPAWDASVIVLALGGLLVRGIGLVLALKRLRRGVSKFEWRKSNLKAG